MLLTDSRADGAGRRSGDSNRLALPDVLIGWARAPINRVLQHRGNRAIMLGRYKQRGVSSADFIGKADDGDGPLAVEIVVIHGEIIDSDEFELEFVALAEAYEGMRQPAIYGFSAIAAYDCRDFEFSHYSPSLSAATMAANTKPANRRR